MDLVRQIVFLVAAFSVAAIIVGVGMDATLEDFLTLLRQPRRLARAVVAVNLVTPLAGAVLIAIFPMSPTSREALMLMAVSPVPPFVPSKVMATGAHRAYAYGLYAALVLLSVVVVPLTVEVLARVYGVPVSISPLKVARQVVFTALLPLAFGLLIRRGFPDFAKRAAPVVVKSAQALVVVIVIAVLAVLWPRLARLAGDGTIAATVLMVAAALAAGHFLGGPNSEDRSSLAITAATRHPGIAMMIARTAGWGREVSMALVLVLLVGVIAVLPYQLWRMRSARGPRGIGKTRA